MYDISKFNSKNPNPDKKCQNVNCNKYGTCDTTTGNCACSHGYSGDNCEILPFCDDKKNTEHILKYNNIKNNIKNDIKDKFSNTKLTFGIILTCIAVLIFIFYFVYKMIKIFICGVILFIIGIIFISYYIKSKNICNCQTGYKCVQTDGNPGTINDNLCVECKS